MDISWAIYCTTLDSVIYIRGWIYRRRYIEGKVDNTNKQYKVLMDWENKVYMLQHFLC